MHLHEDTRKLHRRTTSAPGLPARPQLDFAPSKEEPGSELSRVSVRDLSIADSRIASLSPDIEAVLEVAEWHCARTLHG